jgi:hypothetical protein
MGSEDCGQLYGMVVPPRMCRQSELLSLRGRGSGLARTVLYIRAQHSVRQHSVLQHVDPSRPDLPSASCRRRAVGVAPVELRTELAGLAPMFMALCDMCDEAVRGAEAQDLRARRSCPTPDITNKSPIWSRNCLDKGVHIV